MVNHDGEPLQIILIGETGVGKSTLSNFLYSGVSGQVEGQETFKRGHGAESCTSDTKREYFKFNGQTLSIVDTPGLNDSGGDDKVVLQAFRKFLDENQNASAVVLVLNGTAPRITPFHQEMFRMVREIFGDDVDKILGVCLTNVAYSSSAIKKRKSKNQSDDSMKDSPIELLKKNNIFCPRKQNWYIIDAEYDPEEEEESRIALASRERLLQWAANNPIVKTTFRIDLEQKEQMYLQVAKETGELRKNLLELSAVVFQKLGELVSPNAVFKRKTSKEYFEYQPNKAKNAVIGILSLGMCVMVDKVRITFESTDGDGDDSDDRMVETLLYAVKDFTLQSLQRMLTNKDIGLRDFEVSQTHRSGATEQDIKVLKMVLCGTQGFAALAQAATNKAAEMTKTKVNRQETSWKC
uniref:AIG1-type G domain-containing protein n=1 Tax=Erythrolobus australicus TaxID=1077150 RepID=A0A7S1TJY3_9RHOD|mmetsp:Transcript_2143/g.5780  ORF Transcript_2143/g.5780 Transcript_2143/m.5780 type:complete len:409 (+) Transcript_2143:91-1317(+)